MPSEQHPPGPPSKPESDSKEKSDKDKPDTPDDKAKGADKSKPDEPKPTLRPTKPPKPANPDELKVRPDKDGKVRFNFTGQAWLDVLQWLADISDMSLDWQELPSDYLNLVTQRSYTVEEARRVINRHLVVRGYSLLHQGEVLTVVNLKKLDPAMVPRVESSALDDRDPSEFVKVSFSLDSLLAEVLVEELKPMLSPCGKLVALAGTNRLEAIDAAGNLREIRDVLSHEQSPAGRNLRVREFALQYARAPEVLDQLQTLLAIETKSSGSKGPPSPEQMQQMMQQQQQMMQQMQNRDQGNKPVGHPKPKVEINLVANSRRNSIVAHAPPDKMAIIEQAVKTLDVQVENGQSLLASLPRMQVYRLAAIDPEPLVKTLQEVGNLDPKTRLQIDKPNKSIIAYATLADHATIRAVVEKLDGTGRRFEVIPLRRLQADYVAGTIGFLITGGKEKKKESRSPFFGWGDGGGSRPQQTEEKPNEFRVDADIEYNRLLLWANDVEVAEVHNLLVKLGEIPSDGKDAGTVRMLDVTPGKETDQWLERVRAAWPSVGKNPLVVPPPEEPAKTPPPKEPPKPTTPPKSTSTQPWDPYVQWAELRTEASPDSQPAAKPSAEAAPITISRLPDGRLMISSADVQALDQLEELMGQLSPPARIDYKIFRLKYAWAYGVAMNLKDVFKEDDKEGRRNPFFWWDNGSGREESDKGQRLSKRRPLKIISDADTNSILVQGADPGQLRKIQDIIEFYDRPDPTDAKSVRKTQTIRLRFAQAKVVADTIKDVYRDLLSANDKALQGGQQNQRPSRSYTFVFGDNGSNGSEQRAPTFKGLLSVGVDEMSNTLIVSAPVFLFEDVTRLIDELDQASEPVQMTVQVLRLGNGVGASDVQEALSRVYGSSSATAGRRPDANPSTPPSNARPGGRSSNTGQGNARH
jgi:type II secretory pathway component GspD/PulD (secretin)